MRSWRIHSHICLMCLHHTDLWLFIWPLQCSQCIYPSVNLCLIFTHSDTHSLPLGSTLLWRVPPRKEVQMSRRLSSVSKCWKWNKRKSLIHWKGQSLWLIWLVTFGMYDPNDFGRCQTISQPSSLSLPHDEPLTRWWAFVALCQILFGLYSL